MIKLYLLLGLGTLCISISCSDQYFEKKRSTLEEQIDWTSWGLSSKRYKVDSFESKVLFRGRAGYQKLTVIAKDQSCIIVAFKQVSTGCVAYTHFFQDREC